MYRHIAQLEPINTEALSCIAVHHFYGNQPEMALMYYRYSSRFEISKFRNTITLNIGCCIFIDEFYQWGHIVVSFIAIWDCVACTEGS